MINTWLEAMGYDNDALPRGRRGAAVDGAGLDDARARRRARPADDPLHAG